MMIEARLLAIAGRLAETDLRLRAGQMTALIGPNGGGKTSLLRALAGVEGASGTTTIGDEDLSKATPARLRRLVGYLPASRDIRWAIAVRDIIALGLERRDPERVEALLGLFELENLADRPADSLSTGERARVLMARVLASRPALLLLDEPLSNLDPYWVIRFLAVMASEAERGAAVLVALHDLAQLPRFERALLVADGRVLCDETPERLLASRAFERAFRVRPTIGGYAISPSADRQSSP